ncbi:MAG: PASTA domain-containing protein [Clostridia bacterium]|nr:PASTA domain-containing protein [Clostridia bacterium]
MATENKPTVTTRTPTRQMRRRALVAIVLVGLFFAGNIAQLVRLQILESEDWQKRAVSQQMSDTVVTAKRGTIYDTAMQPLAESAEVWKIIMSPKDIAELDWKKLQGVDTNRTLTDEQALELLRTTIAKGLSELFKVDYDKLYTQTGKVHSQYEVIKSKVEYNDKTAFSEWVTANGLSRAFYIITDYKRYYSQGTLASTVLGFTGTDNNGLEGLEAKYETVLAGTPGRIVTAQNGIGDQMPTTMEYTKVVDAVDGYSLVTTIDSTVQMYAEKYLYEAVQANGATNRGVAIVMDVHTGAILAMATKGDYNPNDPFTIADPTTATTLAELSGDEQAQAISVARQYQWKNKALTDTYEPGSVFKVFTTAMGLEENLISESKTFNCANSIMVGGWKIRCHIYPRAHGTLNLPDAVSKSCNPYFVQLGMLIGPNTFYKYFSGFGFTEKTGIDMNGETSNAGLFYGAEHLAEYDSSLATAAFGQTFKVTPVQMISALAAIANGGKLVTPYVVSEVLDGEGHVISATEPAIKRQIISENTSKRLCKILGDIVNGGGSKNAYVAGYRVAGKTGTSEKRDIKDRHDVVASFGGFAPADNPKVAVLVLVDEPQCATNLRYGGTVSAPVAQKIFEAILPHLGVEPSYTEQELATLSRTTPNVVGQAIGAAQTKITNTGLKASVVGSGEKVLRQVPEAGQTVPAGGTVLLYTEDTEGVPVTVPDLLGRSVTEVNTIASRLGLNVQMEGLISGMTTAAVANHQSVAAGQQVPKGTVLRVSFLYGDTTDGGG